MRAEVVLLATDLLRFREARRTARLIDRTPLLLHLGSARARKPGWVNVDLAGKGADVALNLLRPLPFPDESVDGIFHEHLLEHLSLADGLSLSRECLRVLKPGGVLRVATPDAGAYARSYAGDRIFLEQVRPGRPTAMLAFQEIAYRHGHRSLYDFETLRLLLEAAGFVNVRETPFGVTALPVPPDSPHRQHESLYVEALREHSTQDGLQRVRTSPG